MKVTNVKIVQSKKPGNLKAWVDITFDDVLVCKGWKVIDGKNGLFLAAPSRQDKNDPKKFYDNILFAGAMNKGTPGEKARQYVQTEVLRKFTEVQSESTSFDQTTGSYPDDDIPF